MTPANTVTPAHWAVEMSQLESPVDFDWAIELANSTAHSTRASAEWAVESTAHWAFDSTAQSTAQSTVDSTAHSTHDWTVDWAV